MSKKITFSRTFPAYHPRKGEPTYFVEAILTQLNIKYKSYEYYLWLIENNPKIGAAFLQDFWISLMKNVPPKSHTIRQHKRPLKIGEFINPNCWAGKPYNKTKEGFWQIKFAPDVLVKKTWSIDIRPYFVNDKLGGVSAILINDCFCFDWLKLASNDGLSEFELCEWFKPSLPIYKANIICWNENINY